MRFAFLLLSFHLIVFHAENLSGSVKGFERSVVKIILRCHIQRFCSSDGVTNIVDGILVFENQQILLIADCGIFSILDTVGIELI